MDLICGINPVLEALVAQERHFDHVVVAKGVRSRRVAEALSRAGRLGVPLRFESREALDRLSGGVNHQGVIAVVSPKRLTDLDGVLTDAKHPPLVVVLDGVEDPRNLGAILRTCEAAGADGVVLPERRSAPLSETVARASAGAIEHVQIARAPNLSAALDTLKERGLWVVGFDAAGTERWDGVDLTGPVAIVLGGEGRGMRRLVREKCDHLVSLPLFGHVSSLNVSVAAGIALYEVIRQRGSRPSHVRPIPISGSRTLNIVGPSEDDTEHDPGRTLSGPLAQADSSDDDAPEPGPQLLIEEEAAWSGPTLVKRHSQEGRGRQRRTPGGGPAGGGKKKRRSAPRKKAVSQSGGRGIEPEASAGAGPVVGDASPPRKRGRRRRRPGGRGGDAEVTKPPQIASEQPSNAAPGGEGAPRRRRRRRRRG